MQSTRNKLIQLLEENESDYVSGQLLSEKLGCSRNAIWKQMKNLEKAGYKIEGKSKLGYRILGYPTKLSEYTLKWGLRTTWLGKNMVHKEQTPSTQTIAHQLAHEEAEHGTIIIADEQTSGKGRMGRQWHSSKHKGIWMSMILRPTILPYLAPQLTLLTATVLADAIYSHTNIKPQIKWPNDILINGKKVAGILTEMQAEQDQIKYVVIGIGLNINQTLHDLSDEIKSSATSLQIETNKQWNMIEIVQEVLTTFEKTYMTYIDNGFPNVKNKWESYGYKIGESIWIKTAKDRWEALFLGIAEDGALLTKNNDGEIEKIYSAEIEWFEEET